MDTYTDRFFKTNQISEYLNFDLKLGNIAMVDGNIF